MRDQASEIERAVDASAAVVLAAATALCCVRLSLSLPIVGAVVMAGFSCSFALLRAVRPEERHFPISTFAPAEVQALSGKSELHGAGDAEDSIPKDSPELLLDDVLAELAPDSRVVRLFDPMAMPTPGELRARIHRHLGSEQITTAPPHPHEVDASHALHEALAELRRSLR